MGSREQWLLCGAVYETTLTDRAAQRSEGMVCDALEHDRKKLSRIKSWDGWTLWDYG